MLPIADVKAQPVRSERDPDRPKIFWLIPKEFLLPGHSERAAVALDRDAGDLTFAEIGEKQIIPILRGQGIIRIGDSAAGRAGAEVMDHPESIRTLGNEVV